MDCVSSDLSLPVIAASVIDRLGTITQHTGDTHVVYVDQKVSFILDKINFFKLGKSAPSA